MKLAATIRAVAAFVEATMPADDDVYVPKTRDELEPFLALSPYVFGLPMEAVVTARFLIAARPIPVHILGIVTERAWADGRWCSPADFFYHDLDHARFKIREDLLALGYDCPDVDRERTFLPHARQWIHEAGPKLWELAPNRLDLVRRLLSAMDALPDGERAQSAELLLFELVHEKGFPVDSGVLQRELRNVAHIAKLRRKCAAGFYGESNPGERVTGRLEDARDWLIEQL